jgi:hypothetical protein
LIREFQRKAGLYSKSPPAWDDTMGWLALMEHYGAPTRLLDWTYSFFAASSFAVNELRCNEKVGEVWAMNTTWLTGVVEVSLRTDCGNLRTVGNESEGSDFTGLLAKKRGHQIQPSKDLIMRRKPSAP